MHLDELFDLRKADKEREVKLLEKLDRMSGQLLSLSESSQEQSKLIYEQKRIISDLQKQNELLQKENVALKEQKKLFRKGLYSSKSQKLSKKKKEVSSHEENKGDFYGTSGPMNPLSQEAPVKTERSYRRVNTPVSNLSMHMNRMVTSMSNIL